MGRQRHRPLPTTVQRACPDSSRRPFTGFGGDGASFTPVHHEGDRPPVELELVVVRVGVAGLP